MERSVGRFSALRKGFSWERGCHHSEITYPVLVAVASKEDIITDIVIIQVFERSVAVGGVPLEGEAMSASEGLGLVRRKLERICPTFQLSPLMLDDSMMREKMI